MCLTIYKIKTKKELARVKSLPKIAKRAIKVFKVLKEEGVSKYRGFHYQRGNHYYQEGKQKFTFDIGGYKGNWVLHINQGLHSYNTIERAKEELGWYERVVTMYIPRGSQYYRNHDGELVSDQLIWY